LKKLLLEPNQDVMDTLDSYGLPVWGAPERNKQPILEQLKMLIPSHAKRMLEISSATGQHAEHFARELPGLEIQTSDFDAEHLVTLEARSRLCGLANFLAPVRLDVTEDNWPVADVDVIYNANMVHIAPFEVAEGLFRGAGQVLRPGALMITYGPYRLNGEHTSESNAQFDASLKARDPRFGVRDLQELARLAEAVNMVHRPAIAMPANNFLVVWDKRN
jgi:SAM-dependent methyltransferase